MSRSARLAVATLLLAIAGVLWLIREGAADVQAMRVMIGVFAVPGLILLALGILPPRTLPAGTRMTFKPQILALGLLVATGGVVMVALHQILPVMPHALSIGGLIAVPVGLLYAGHCWTECCAKCRTPLVDKRIAFHADANTVAAAIRTGSAMRILELAPYEDGSAMSSPLRGCPDCKRIALLSGPGDARATLFDDPAIRLLQYLER